MLMPHMNSYVPADGGVSSITVLSVSSLHEAVDALSRLHRPGVAGHQVCDRLQGCLQT